MSLIPVQLACETLNILDSSLCMSKKYEQFYYPAQKGKKGSLFDMDGFLKREDMKFSLIEKTKLLIEYLNKIEKISYKRMASISGVDYQTTHSLIFGYGSALKIAYSMCRLLPFHVKRFDEYYDFSVATSYIRSHR